MPVEYFQHGNISWVRYSNAHGKIWEEHADKAYIEAKSRNAIFTQIYQAAPGYVLEKSNFHITTRRLGSLADEVCRTSSDLDILIIFSVLDSQEYIRHARFWMKTLSKENHDNGDVFCGVYHRPIFLDLFFAIFDQSKKQEIPVNPFK